MSRLRPLGDDAENVNRSRICGFSEICHCREVERVKRAVVCYFQCTMFNATNLLNLVAPSIELMMQICAIQY